MEKNPKKIVLIVIVALLTVAAIVPHIVYNSSKDESDTQVDLAAYNALVHENDSLKLALDSMISLHSKMSTDITKEVANQLRKRALIDSVYKVIDGRLDTLYADRVSSANLVPYEEFASAIITIPYEEVQSRCNFANITDDPELIQAFQTFFDARNMEYFNEANEKMRSKPSFFNAGLSDSEIQFYDSLYLAGLPYQPYSPKRN